MDDAKDELFAHMQRCEVPGADTSDVRDWMNDTRQFLSDRYPQLTEAQLASLETIGRRYAQPVIPHGKDATARNRDEWEGDAAAEHATAGAEEDSAADVEDSEQQPDELQTV